MAYQPELEKLERRYQDDPSKNFAQLAEAYRRTGRVDEALNLLGMHLEERPNYVSALIVLGRCHLDKEQDGDAAQAFERVLAVDPENIIALKMLGEIARRAGERDRARGWFERLLEVDPMNEEAEATLAALAAAPAGEPAETVEVEDAGAAAPFAEPDAPTETIQIERASAQFEPPTEEQAAQTISDFELETSPEAELPPVHDEPPTEEIPAVSRDSSAVEAMEVESAPPAEPTEPAQTAAQQSDETIELQPFDANLAWGTGERLSREISREDLEAAHYLHDETIDQAAVQELPGLEHADVPGLEEGKEAPPAAGFVPAELAGAGEDVAPVEGLEPADAEAAKDVEGVDVEDEEVEEEVEEEEEVAGGAEVAEVEEARPSLAGLPVYLPEPEPEEEPAAPGVPPRPSGSLGDYHRSAEGEEESAEPEPVVTETMAELYARQGLTEEASRVYRQLLAERPGDPQLVARLEDLEAQAARPAPAAAAASERAASSDPRSRYLASETGGTSTREFLVAILEGRETAPAAGAVSQERPSPIDEAFDDEPLEPRGAPTRPASDQPSLAEVFGEQPVPAPPSPPAAPPAGERGRGAAGGFSFDEFFGGEGGGEEPPRASGGRAPRVSADDVDDTDEGFKAWLRGLKS